MFDRDRPPEELAGFGAAMEASGLDDLWVVEDLGWAGSVASCAIALATTRRLRVGIGIAPAPLRNPVLLAMELATLARAYPGRLVAGIGHGVADWMRQVGAGAPRPLALLEETITAVGTLLRGQRLTLHGVAVQVDGVRLVHPPAVPPPIVAGVVRPRSLRLSGRVADGTVIAEGHGPADIATALGHIRHGRDDAGGAGGHELVVFAFLSVHDDPARCEPALTAALAGQAQWLGVAASEVFRLAGPATAAADGVRSLWAAGADTVVLRPLGPDPAGQVRATLAALGR